MSDDTYEQALHQDGRDLVDLARRGILPEPIARDSEVATLWGHVRQDRSLVLVGPSGVGKTAIIHGLAALLARSGSQGLCELSTATILARTRYLGEWQTKVQAMLKEAERSNTLLYLTDLANLWTAGRASGSTVTLWEAFAPALEAGRVTLIGEMSPEQYAVLVRDPRASALFTVQRVAELSPTAVHEVLSQSAADRSLELSAEGRQALLQLTRRFLPDRPAPGAALKLLDAVAEARRKAGPAPLTAAFIEQTFADQTGLPPFIVSREATRKVADVRAWFEERIIGQVEAIETVVEMVALFKAGLHDPDRPIGTFLFVGPTGVGKTELARSLAAFLYGSDDRLLRFDLSELKDSAAIERLVGTVWKPELPAPLIDPVRAQPFQVILFDELEKAHPNIWDLLLPLLDAGRLTPPNKPTVDFRRTIVICTSNVGAIDATRGVGFGAAVSPETRRARTREALENHFRPELLNRFQHIAVFHHLNVEQVRAVARQELRRVLLRDGIADRNLHVDVDDAAIDLAIERGHDERYGARALKRVIQRQIVLPIALSIMERKVEPNQILRVTAVDSRVRVKVLDTEISREVRKEQEPVRRADGQRASREELLLAVQGARQELLELSVAVDEERNRAARQDLLERRRSADFWRKPDEAAAALAELERLTSLLDRLDRTRSKLEQVGEDLRGADTRARLQRVALHLDQFDDLLRVARRELVTMGPDGLADALVELRPVAGQGRRARDFLFGVYRDWAQQQQLTLELLCDPVSAEEPYLLRLKGRYATGLLRLESGLHRVAEAERTSVARVRVWATSERTGEPALIAQRMLAAVGASGGKVRSRQEYTGGLLLQGDRTPDAARVLASELGPSWAAGPAPLDTLVRRYQTQPPLVKDYLTREVSHRADALSAERFGQLLLRRLDNVHEDAGGEPTEELPRTP